MTHLALFVCKLVPVDAERSASVSIEEIATLCHETVDDTMKDGTLVPHRFVVHAVLACAKLSKVLRRPGM